MPATDRTVLAEDEAAVAVGAAACIDVWMGGDTSWRTREGDGPSVEFMAGADWEMAVSLTKAVLNAVAPAGSRLLAPGHVLMPQNADEAKAMWLVGERWMRDNAPALLRASTGAGAAEAMRERAAAYFDDLAAQHEAAADSATGPDQASVMSKDHHKRMTITRRRDAAAIRALSTQEAQP